MKNIHDKKIIRLALEEMHAEEIFSNLSLPFVIREYDSEEFLSSPIGSHRKELLFLLSGTVHVFGLHEEDRLIPINLIEKGSLIGDIEYVGAQNKLYAKAANKVRCLVLSVEQNKEILDNDVKFLRFLARSLADKVYLGQGDETLALSVEERLLYYMKKECENQVLHGTGKASLRLHCSRRQVQRALKKLCQEKTIEKICNGTYRYLGN